MIVIEALVFAGALPKNQYLYIYKYWFLVLHENMKSYCAACTRFSKICLPFKSTHITEQGVDDAAEHVDGDEYGVDDGVRAGVEREGGGECGAVGALADEEAGVEGGAVDADEEDAVREVDAPAASLPLPHPRSIDDSTHSSI